MNTTTRRRAALAGGLVALSLIAAACGGDDDNGSGATTTAGSGGGDLSGSVVVTGSSTVEPISAAVAELFAAEAPNVNVSVSGPGTGDGFEQFCNGEADVADASRPIQAEELESCEANGIEVIELKVAVDGLSVITSASNADLACLSFKDLYALLGPESTGFGDWSDADDLAAELVDLPDEDFGTVHAPYPDVSLSVTAPGEESGTYDSFIEIAIEGIADERGQDAVARPDYTASPNDNVIIQGISGSDTSLGWVGFAFVAEHLDTIRPVQVDGGAGCIEPTPDTIASGEYPIARDLFIYVDKAEAEANPALVAYVDLYLDSIAEGGVIGTEAGQVPYIPITAEDLATTTETWEARTTGAAAQQ